MGNAAEVRDPKMVAAIDLLRRTGAADTQIRYSDDGDPTVWLAVVRHRVGTAGVPVATGYINSWEAAAGHTPVEALLRLCERVIDGGHCAHCQRPTMFHADLDDAPLPGVDVLFCAYEWDPELATFRRGCEGDR